MCTLLQRVFFSGDVTRSQNYESNNELLAYLLDYVPINFFHVKQVTRYSLAVRLIFLFAACTNLLADFFYYLLIEKKKRE